MNQAQETLLLYLSLSVWEVDKTMSLLGWRLEPYETVFHTVVFVAGLTHRGELYILLQFGHTSPFFSCHFMKDGLS